MKDARLQLLEGWIWPLSRSVNRRWFPCRWIRNTARDVDRRKQKRMSFYRAKEMRLWSV